MHKISRQQLNQEINDKLNSIGNKSNLSTNYKEDLVGAINEVNENVKNHTHDAGDITSGVLNIARIPNIPGTKVTGSVANANNAVNANTVGGYTAEQLIGMSGNLNSLLNGDELNYFFIPNGNRTFSSPTSGYITLAEFSGSGIIDALQFYLVTRWAGSIETKFDFRVLVDENPIYRSSIDGVTPRSVLGVEMKNINYIVASSAIGEQSRAIPLIPTKYGNTISMTSVEWFEGNFPEANLQSFVNEIPSSIQGNVYTACYLNSSFLRVYSNLKIEVNIESMISPGIQVYWYATGRLNV